MFVCICQSIKEKEVRASVAAGAKTVGEVFKSHGCRPDCGKCIASMRQTIDEERQMVKEASLLAAE